MKTTPVFRKNAEAYNNPSIRRAFNKGGTSSSKTISILQLLYLVTLYAHEPLLVSVVSESVPHLKRGCIRDFKSVILGSKWREDKWNATDCIYQVSSMGQMEFFSADNSSKLRGGRRDILFLNEANNNTLDVFNELDIRTRLFTFLDWNPTHEFWANDMLKDPENAYIHSTYKDALSVLPQSVIDNIESRKAKDPNWWRVYGEGEDGKLEGLVHPLFDIVDAMPEKGTGVEIYGLDFGFTNDPTALTRNVIIDDHVFSEVLIYETGLTNQDIAERMEELGMRKGYDEIIADSAEPKSIEEISRLGWDVKPAEKGQDSLLVGIQCINNYHQHWVKASIDGIKEQRNYRFVIDKNGKFTNKPIDVFNHAMDSRRYAVAFKARQVLPSLFVA